MRTETTLPNIGTDTRYPSRIRVWRASPDAPVPQGDYLAVFERVFEQAFLRAFVQADGGRS